MVEWIVNHESQNDVSIEERALQYGDGLFETIAIRNGEPRLWRYHMERLAQGCERLNIAMPSTTGLRDSVSTALARNEISDVYAVTKIIVSAGVGRRSYGRKPCGSPTILVGAFASRPAPMSAYREGVDTTVCDLRLATKSPLAGLKTLNRLEQVLARSELMGRDVFEGLTLDADERLICGTMSNVFFVKEGKIMTPAIDGSGVSGVMRRHILETLRLQDVNVEIGNSGIDALGTADEVFLSNSQFGVILVRSCDEHNWPVGSVTKNVTKHLADTGVSEFLR